jgi:phage shock protein A
MQEEHDLANQALMQIQALELTLLQLEHRYPYQRVNLAEVGRYHLDAFRKLVGNPEMWKHA